MELLKPKEEIGRSATEFLTAGTSLSLGSCNFSHGSSAGKDEQSKMLVTCLNEVSRASGKKQVARNCVGEGAGL